MRVLVIGVTGELGAEVARALAVGGVEVRAMTRRAERPHLAGVDDFVRADLGDPRSLGAALEDVQRMFLVSSPATDQVELETNAIAAAESAGVQHLVKISNLPIAGLDSGLHGNHRAIERRLAASSVPSTVLQPSFFSSVLLRQIGLLRRGRLILPTGDGAIAWIDPRDIAAVAAEVLSDPDPPVSVLRLTGPQALTAAELAVRIGHVVGAEITLGQPDLGKWGADLTSAGMDPWLVESTLHLYAAVAAGALAGVSTDGPRVLGRAARPIDEWLRDELKPRLSRAE